MSCLISLCAICSIQFLHVNNPTISSDEVRSKKKERELTLAKLCLWDSLPDDATGIVDHGGGLKLHSFHYIPHTNL